MNEATQVNIIDGSMLENSKNHGQIHGNVEGVRLLENGSIVFSRDLPITAEVVQECIRLHRTYVLPVMLESHDMYVGNHKILERKANDSIMYSLPNNKVVVNFAKYIVDTYNGFFIGIPPKIEHNDTNINEKIQSYISTSDMDDNLAELSKYVAIYGRAYSYTYQGEDGEVYTTYNSPLDMFVVNDDSIAQTPYFSVRFEQVKDATKKTYDKGEVWVNGEHYLYEDKDKKPLLIEDTSQEVVLYPYNPIIEFIENDSRQSVFENVKSLINAFNQALSDKVNDVEYFANAYMKVTGAKIDVKDLAFLKENRVLNAVGDGSSNVDIAFIERPNADGTQENLLDRLQDLIFITAMVANVTDEDYSNASGTALEFKLLDMKNLAINKERKFTSSLKRLFRLWANIPLMLPNQGDEWKNITFTFTRNIPRNVTEAVENARNLEGIVSRETQLGLLPFVENPQDELVKMDDEKKDNMALFNQTDQTIFTPKKERGTTTQNKEGVSNDEEKRDN